MTQYTDEQQAIISGMYHRETLLLLNKQLNELNERMTLMSQRVTALCEEVFGVACAPEEIASKVFTKKTAYQQRKGGTDLGKMAMSGFEHLVAPKNGSQT